MKSKMKYIILGIILILFISLTILFFIVIKKLDIEVKLFPDYEHYQLDDKDGISYSFLDGEQLITYKIIKTGENEGGEVDSLYYKINPKIDDYILVDELPPDKSENLLDKAYTLFYEDKLYLVRGWTQSIYEYKLNKEKIDIKQINFDTSNIDTDLCITRFSKIENNFVYLSASVIRVGSDVRKSYKMKCSLSNYVCEKVE